MVEIVGCVAMSHGPQLFTPPGKWSQLPTRIKGPFHPKAGIEAELTADAMSANSERCHAAIGVLGKKIESWNPDTIIVVGDDQAENILPDNTPPFTIYIAPEADATTKYSYFGTDTSKQITRYPSDSELAKEVLLSIMDQGFDPSWSKETRYKGGLGHAFGRSLKMLMPDSTRPILAVMVNTYYPPAPTAKRCFDFGAALGRALANSKIERRVALVASGGLSHTKIDESLDRAFMKALESNDAAYLSSIPSSVLVTGTSEIRNWIVVAGAMGAGGKMVDYIPCYRNSDGVGCAMGFAYWDRAAV
jgi:aromatic ring-opening dioxygenase catalytic subunit (LigB family)